MSKLTDIERC